MCLKTAIQIYGYLNHLLLPLYDRHTHVASSCLSMTNFLHCRPFVGKYRTVLTFNVLNTNPKICKFILSPDCHHCQHANLRGTMMKTAVLTCIISFLHVARKEQLYTVHMSVRPAQCTLMNCRHIRLTHRLMIVPSQHWNLFVNFLFTRRLKIDSH